jgi:outer membrane protein
MKKLLSFFAIALVGLLSAFTVQAQKFGYVDSEFVMGKLPAYAAAQQELNTLSGNWQKDIEIKRKILISYIALIKQKKCY